MTRSERSILQAEIDYRRSEAIGFSWSDPARASQAVAEADRLEALLSTPEAEEVKPHTWQEFTGAGERLQERKARAQARRDLVESKAALARIAVKVRLPRTPIRRSARTPGSRQRTSSFTSPKGEGDGPAGEPPLVAATSRICNSAPGLFPGSGVFCSPHIERRNAR